MSIFSDSDLQDFGDLAVSLALKDTATIKRYTRVDDGQGGHAGDTLTTVATVPCMVSDIPTKTYQITLAQRTTELVIKRISLPRLTDVRIDDLITAQSITYKVIGLGTITSYEVLRHVSVTVEA